MFDETGAVQQQSDDSISGQIAEEAAVEETAGVEGEVAQEDAFAIFGGEEVKVEKRQKDAHKATITSVSENISETGSRSLRVVFHSDDTGNEITWDIWVPAMFADNTGAFLTRKLGIEDLPPGEPDPDRPGKLKGNQRTHYGMGIKNSAKDASVQQLLAIAVQEGRQPGELSRAFNEGTTFGEYAAALNEILADLPVVVTRIPEASEENPRGYLKVNRVYSQSILDDPKALKALSKYVQHWTVGA
jgi:hypothetical protein